MPAPVGTAVQGGGVGQSLASPLTLAHNSSASGSRRFLSLGLCAFSGSGSITGANYNGVAMTLGPTFGALGTGLVRLYGLVAPATGSNNITITGTGTLDELFILAQTWENVNQTTPWGTQADASGNGTTISDTVSLSGSDVALGLYYGYSGGNTTLVESDTLIIETDLTSAASGRALQYGDATLGWTIGAAADNFLLMAPLIHDGGGGGGAVLRRNSLLRLGVGR